MGTALVQRYSCPVKSINKRYLAIAGAGMLFLGLSGSLQAMPFSMSHHLERSMSSFASLRNHQNFGDYRVIWQGDGRPKFSLPADTRQNYSLPAIAVRPEFAVTRTLPKPATEPYRTSNVPEGGVTAMLVGAAMVGIALMRKMQAV